MPPQAVQPAPRPVTPRYLRLRPTPYFDPYNGAYAPLTDDSWMGIPAAVWNLTPVAPPPIADAGAVAPVASPGADRAPAVKFTQQTLQIGSTPTAILPERADRQFLTIQNAAGATIYIGFSEIPNSTTGIEILVGGALVLNDPAPSNQIYVVCPTATATVRVLEG